MSGFRYMMRAPKRAVRCEDDVWSEPRESMDVIIVSDDPIDTGLVDESGVPIMRVSNKDPIGFCR